MPKYKVFVDGAVGTTGLRIHQRLQNAEDIELITLPEEQRKQLPARLAAVQAADVTMLCLPDEAAKQLVDAAPADAKICDASTAHRTNPGWVYGFAELASRRRSIAGAKRVAVPGCHASGFLALAAPLVEKGALPANHPFVCHSLTGYSGGGKAMIAAYEDKNRPESYSAPRLYALGMAHKHLPEMQAVAQLAAPPLFCPVVDDYYSGMLVSLPIPIQALLPPYNTKDALTALLAEYYDGEALVRVHPYGKTPEDGTLSAGTMVGRDDMELFVLGSETQALLCARFDNLGKGASGAAVQCINLMLGREETGDLVF